MTDKEIINDYKEMIHNLQRECTEKTNNIVALSEQLKHKEQECEKLKKKFKNLFGIDNEECWTVAFLNNENARYKQALEEIKNYCISCKYGLDVDKITDLINEVKE